MRTKIVISDDQRINIEGLKALFTSAPEIEVVGAAEDGHGVVELTQSLSPDVVLMGMDIPGLNAMDATRRMLELKPSVRIIGLSSDIDGQLVRELLAAGGAGFITKCNGFTDFLDAVRSVMAKRIYLSPDVAQVMVDQYVLRPTAERNGSALVNLTPREREVLQLVCEGMSTKQAATTLKISTKTVDMHRQHIMNKLQLHSVAELTKYAIREGITALHS
ncbi:MAG: response regulator transcription factor [Tepidisphaeraceae bacterium]